VKKLDKRMFKWRSQVNKVLIETGDLVGIKVLDHLIVGDGKWENI